jgi:hypothetical protein
MNHIILRDYSRRHGSRRLKVDIGLGANLQVSTIWGKQIKGACKRLLKFLSEGLSVKAAALIVPLI